MRLSENQKQEILKSCVVSRPGAVLRRMGSTWGAVWRVSYDSLVDSGVKVSANARWRSQLLTRIDAEGIWWSGEEHQHSTRSGATQMAENEAIQYV